MTTRARILADSVLMSRDLLKRYLAGFDDTNHTQQTAGLPNHVAWTLGHLALYMNRSAEKLDGVGLPESDFYNGEGRGGQRERFDTESVLFGSTPAADAAAYPPMTRCVEVFDRAIERLARVVREADDAALDRPAKWDAAELPAWATAARIVFHNGTHCGQIADLRRSLGMKSVFA